MLRRRRANGHAQKNPCFHFPIRREKGAFNAIIVPLRARSTDYLPCVETQVRRVFAGPQRGVVLRFGVAIGRINSRQCGQDQKCLDHTGTVTPDRPVRKSNCETYAGLHPALNEIFLLRRHQRTVGARENKFIAHRIPGNRSFPDRKADEFITFDARYDTPIIAIR